MIVRTWSARATRGGADDYERHFRAHVLPALARLDGHCGAQLLRRDADGDVALTVVSYWESIAAVTRFAGDDAEAAVVEDDARAALTSYDTRVRHFELRADTTR